jgi:hypothetical protein
LMQESRSRREALRSTDGTCEASTPNLKPDA